MKMLNEKELHDLVHRISITYFQKPFQDKVRFNPRLRTTGGRYIPTKRLIELNPKYVEEMGEEELIGIIKHELCHYHLHIEGKGYQHRDQDFKILLKKTGSPRHCKPLPSQKERFNHIYQCCNCHLIYKRVRMVNVSKYRCGKCRGKLIKVHQ
ncbi:MULTISPECIES: SprT family protein [unclassified Virgibacillus]|uniref:SprT family protein n=1 Tax=unclassified Virgibacillus TaxID=2620237 RepID=UPI0024DEDC51|nr:SprT family protein [Virgibacillus sp. LDC-1]